MAIVTRVVAGTLKTFEFPDMSPGLSARLADMKKWDIEVDLNLHARSKKFKMSDYRDVMSLQTGRRD